MKKKQANPIAESLFKIYDEIVSNQCKTICITSSLPNEGKTTIATALAKAVAATNLKVLYCDFCDDEKALSQQQNKSFIEVNGNELEQIKKNIYFNENLGFYLLPPPNPKLLDIKILIHVLEELKNEYDLILIDTNYFNSHTESGISTEKLCKIADATILVVLSNGVTEDEVKEVIDKMKLKKIKLMGFVMNDIHYPNLLKELNEASHHLDEYFPKLSQKLRNWLNSSSLLKIEI